MAQFELAVLGMPRFQAHGQPVRFATRKAQALLIFLAVEGVPVARDTLIDLLWSGSDLARGQISLRKTLARLRQGLDERTPDTSDAPLTPASQPLLLAEAGTLRINPEADCQLDVRTLDRAFALARSFKTDSVAPPELRRVLEQAVMAYAGDFLLGFSTGDSPTFDDWASLQREKWHARLSAVLDRLSQLQFEGGEFAAGIETAIRWIAHDALNEIAHRRLMQLHLATGNRAGALAAYEACQTILARELNASPAPETEALADVLRTQTVPTTVAEATPEAERLRVPATALIGRAAEHGQLIHAYRMARDSQAQAVVIQGEPGIGKTRLAQEFQGWAGAQGAVVLHAAAYELTGNLPYQVWTDAFRAQLNGSHGRKTLAALDRPWQSMLAHLLPELDPTGVTSGATEGSTPLNPARNQHQLFEAAFQFLQHLAQPRMTLPHRTTESPCVLLLDDAQWIDAASSDLLHYLARRCAEARLPLLLVLILRAEAADAFEPPLSALRRHMQVKTLLLTPLSATDSQHLVKALVTQAFEHDALTGKGGDGVAQQQIERFAQTLFAETAGHPLYLLETFKSLLESAAVDVGVGVGVGEPNLEGELGRWQTALESWVAPGVKEVIEARLGRVQPEAMALIQALAVLGQNNAFEACYGTAGLSEADALGLLDETIRRGLVRESADGALSFTHDKIREVVYAGLSAARRRSLHRRAAETLERLYPSRLDDYAPLIAQHFDTADDPRAQPHFRRAGNVAARLYAYREAAAHYARAIALAVAEERDLADDDRRAEARAAITDQHFKLAGMHIQVGHYGASVEVVRQLGALARAWQDAALEHATRVWIAPNLALPGPGMDLDEAEQLAEQILPEARAAQSLHDEVQALRTTMRVALRRAQFDRALTYGQAILARVEVWPNDPLHAHVLHDLALTEAHRHDFEAAQRHQTEALAFWRALDWPALIVGSLSHACFITTCRGEYASAVALSQEAHRISQHIDNDWAVMMSLSRAGPAYVELGQVDHALAVMQETLRLSPLGQHDSIYISTSADLAQLYAKLGQVSEGLAVAQAAYDVAGSRMPEWRPYIVPVLVQLHMLQGELCQADTWLAQGRASLNAEHPWPAARILLDAAEAELALAQGDAVRAGALSATCVAACREQGWRQQLPLMLLLQGQALRALGRPERGAGRLTGGE